MKHLWAVFVDAIEWFIILGTVGWVCVRAYRRSPDRRELLIKWAASVLLFALIFAAARYFILLAIIPAVILGFVWVPTIGEMLVKPLTDAFDGGREKAELKPFYYLAEGKRQKGLYQEAIDEVRRQLERFPGDYEGYLKLATIQAENLKNFPAAKETLEEYLALPGVPANQRVSVLHLIADWQLQFARDPASSKATLQRVIDLYPDTQVAHAAQQRVAHLADADAVHHARFEKKFTVTPREKDLGLKNTDAEAPADPRALAQQYVKQLEEHPFDTETREKLALVYAEQFQRVDLATDQLEQLIALAKEPPKQIARWLQLLATLQIKYGNNFAAAQVALQQIINRFPGSALAEVATIRLGGLKAEFNGLQTTAVKTMGPYERNIGLRQ